MRKLFDFTGTQFHIGLVRDSFGIKKNYVLIKLILPVGKWQDYPIVCADCQIYLTGKIYQKVKQCMRPFT